MRHPTVRSSSAIQRRCAVAVEQRRAWRRRAVRRGRPVGPHLSRRFGAGSAPAGGFSGPSTQCRDECVRSRGRVPPGLAVAACGDDDIAGPDAGGTATAAPTTAGPNEFGLPQSDEPVELDPAEFTTTSTIRSGRWRSERDGRSTDRPSGTGSRPARPNERQAPHPGAGRSRLGRNDQLLSEVDEVRIGEAGGVGLPGDRPLETIAVVALGQVPQCLPRPPPHAAAARPPTPVHRQGGRLMVGRWSGRRRLRRPHPEGRRRRLDDGGIGGKQQLVASTEPDARTEHGAVRHGPSLVEPGDLTSSLSPCPSAVPRSTTGCRHRRDLHRPPGHVLHHRLAHQFGERAANADRHIVVSRASDATDQGRAGSRCMSETARPMRGSCRAPSHSVWPAGSLAIRGRPRCPSSCLTTIGAVALHLGVRHQSMAGRPRRTGRPARHDPVDRVHESHRSNAVTCVLDI